MHLVDRSIRFVGGNQGFLLIHGLGGTPLEMRYLAHGFARAGYSVYVPQLAGHCGSFNDLKVTNWMDWYDSVEKAHRSLRQSCDSVVVGGSSMGALLSLHHAAEHPHDVSALALYAPSLWLDGWGIPWYMGLFNLITQKWLADFVVFAEREPWGVKDPRIKALVEKAIISGESYQAGIAALPGRLMLELRCLVRRVRREIAHVRQPTLIVHPRRDDRASMRNVNYLQSMLPGLTETLVLDDSYHLVTLDRQRHLVLGRTLEFVSQVTRRATCPAGDEQDLDWLLT